MNIFTRISLVFGTLVLASCSTVRTLCDGEYRLASNKVEVTNDKRFNAGQLQPYIKQKSNTYLIFGWSPFLNVYNWSNPDGNSFLDRVFRKVGEAPVVYDPDMVEKSVESIRSHLDYLGYYDSRVDSDVTVKGKRVKVKYLVNLGRQIPISRIDFKVPDRQPLKDDFFADTASVAVKVGDMLSAAALEKESERLSAMFREKGYYGLSKNYFFFSADTLARKGEAVLEMCLNEYTRNETPQEAQPLRKYNFGNVSIQYPKSLAIKEDILKNLNLVKPGMPYGESVVANTYSRLSTLNLFNSVNIELSKVSSDTALVDCRINLSPSKLKGFKANLEMSSNSNGLLGLSPEFSFYHKNIFHGGEWFNMSFMGNFQFKPRTDISSTEFGISAGISIPKFVFLPYRLFPRDIPRSEFKASYNYQDRPEYKRNIISFSAGYTGSHKKLSYQYYPAQINVVRLFSLDDDFYSKMADNPFLKNAYQNHFDFGSGALIYLSSSRDPNPKVSYGYARMQVNLAGNFLSAFKSLMRRNDDGSAMIWDTPYSQYFRMELTLGKTWRFGKNDNQAIATRLLGGAGFAYGNSRALPFEQHFYSGGANSLRGWQARTVGPGLAPMDVTFVIPSQTGDLKLEANAEYRFPMFWKLAGAVFAEAGNVWNMKYSMSGNDSNAGLIDGKTFWRSLAADWGAGIRLDLNFILLRVDMGMRLHDPVRESPWLSPKHWLRKGNYALHFGVGYPF